MRSWLTYIAAFIGGMIAAYLTLWVGAELIFGDAFTLGFILQLVFAPLAGLSTFCLVYRIVDGQVLRGRFWIGALLLLVLVMGASMLLIVSGVTTVSEAAIIAFLGLFILGRMLMERRADG